MNLKPLNDHLLVKIIAPETTTKSGIVLPENVKNDQPEKGEVVAVGDGKLLNSGERVALTVKVGAVVLFKKYAAEEIKIETEKYFLVSESDVLAIVE